MFEVHTLPSASLPQAGAGQEGTRRQIENHYVRQVLEHPWFLEPNNQFEEVTTKLSLCHGRPVAPEWMPMPRRKRRSEDRGKGRGGPAAHQAPNYLLLDLSSGEEEAVPLRFADALEHSVLWRGSEGEGGASSQRPGGSWG